ncbi:MAG: TetR/AcrR family transcriptional regulator, repressor for uid operon [Variibacter sp.]|jgi:AcrR family transcriptional regulator|nr:TetR/AcrR family transcriptional regulator, repressor for uid operon [Variibacter sp.]
MRRASAQLQIDRRAEILDAAARAFSRAGFHGASMQDICAEAGMSPGNLYRYFRSKEEIIAAICERDRAAAVEGFASVAKAPDFWSAFAGLARYHFVERPTDDIALCAEVFAESRRNPQIAKLNQQFDADVKRWLTELLTQAAGRGDIHPHTDVEGCVRMLIVMADGLFWRRATDPTFEAEAALPLFLGLIKHMLMAGPQALAEGETR